MPSFYKKKTSHPEPRRLTEQQTSDLRAYSAIKLPLHQIADLFGMSKSTLERILKKDNTARETRDKGRAGASARVRGVLYEKAVIERDMNAIKFWCSTQEEGFDIVERRELSGPGGDPIKYDDVTDANKDKEIARLQKLLKLSDASEE